MNGQQDRVPVSNRFSARHIWNAHLKGLRNRNFNRPDMSPSAADILARAVLYLVPIKLGVLAHFWGATIAAVDGLLAAAGLLAGGLFMAFTQVAAWRDRYTDRMDRFEDAERPQRYSLDEAVAHILMATYGCFALVVITLVGANFSDKQGHLTGLFSALDIGVGSYILLLMLIILPKLYTSYAVTHRVGKDMSGLSH
jgi:hypothetical protein